MAQGQVACKSLAWSSASAPGDLCSSLYDVIGHVLRDILRGAPGMRIECLYLGFEALVALADLFLQRLGLLEESSENRTVYFDSSLELDVPSSASFQRRSQRFRLLPFRSERALELSDLTQETGRFDRERTALRVPLADRLCLDVFPTGMSSPSDVSATVKHSSRLALISPSSKGSSSSGSGAL